MWLPLRALSNCLDKVAYYMIQNASTRQHDVMIDQFARQERLQVSHLLARAQRTAIRPSTNVMSKPPRVTIRQRPRSKRKTGNAQQMAALSKITPCTHCGRPVARAALITFHHSAQAATLPSLTNGTPGVMGITKGITRLNLG